MSKLIDGKQISEQVKERVSGQVAALKEQGITVGLAVVIVGQEDVYKRQGGNPPGWALIWVRRKRWRKN